MSKANFIGEVLEIIRRSNTNCGVSFEFDDETGRHSAYCGGLRITGNTVTRGLTVRWGSGHQGMVKM